VGYSCLVEMGSNNTKSKEKGHLFMEIIGPVIPILWITKKMMSRGPQVADMECRETT
jgi:hypothetical protein